MLRKTLTPAAILVAGLLATADRGPRAEISNSQAAADWPWHKIYWSADREASIDPGADIPVLVLDAQRNVLDYGTVEHLALHVLRDQSGDIYAVTLAGTAHLGVGRGQSSTQRMSIAVPLTHRTREADDRALIAALLPRGYRGSVALAGDVPPRARGGVFQLDLTPEDLQAAAQRRSASTRESPRPRT